MWAPWPPSGESAVGLNFILFGSRQNNLVLRNVKCVLSISFMQLGRNSSYEFPILHSQTS